MSEDGKSAQDQRDYDIMKGATDRLGFLARISTYILRLTHSIADIVDGLHIRSERLAETVDLWMLDRNIQVGHKQ